MRDTHVKLLSRLHALTYRATGGVIGKRLVNNDMLLLTTTGAKTGKPHTVPLLYLTDGEDVIVIASYGGRPDHPHWYRNLMANPDATVQIRGTISAVRAQTVSSNDREHWWPIIVDAYDDYAVYQSRTEREIPVVRLVKL